MSRIIIVSNRLPVTLMAHGDEVRWRLSPGGLAAALRGVHADADSLWVGFAGDAGKLPEESRRRFDAELADKRLISVPLTPSELGLYYDGFSNGVLWPLFHYLLDKVRFEASNEWRAYRTVNERFARVVAEQVRPGDAVWVHDYHLALVPGLLRAQREDIRVGFFLHVPWPSSDVYRILPQREEILRSLLTADLIGLHTEAYRHNFIHSAANVLDVDVGVDSVTFQDRTVRVGVYPIGIDVARFEQQNPAIDDAMKHIVSGTPNKKRILGVDRLDYTKGIPRRLLALGRLLEREPALKSTVHFIQLAVPTREKVEAYADLRRSVNELVGRINSQHGSPTGSPLQLLYRSVGDHELLALYRTADVMLVTPLRDGMNLVAKEYVASRVSNDGVLVLSEFAGAAAELDAALTVNPYDLDAVARTIRCALSMTRDEQMVRMRRLRDRVRQATADLWARDFTNDLEQTRPVPRSSLSVPGDLDTLVERVTAAPSRVLLLDYDGTLAPIAPLPVLARPDPALRELLRALAALAGAETHIVSGRPPEVLEDWLGGLPLWLHAEHGVRSRAPGAPWTARAETPPFLERAVELLERHARSTPGALVEKKSSSVAFHYRRSELHLAEARVRAIRNELAQTFGNTVEVLEGHKVLEVKTPGITKANVVEEVVARHTTRPLLFAAGDDRTDEDMFSALAEGDVSVRVGPGITRARYRVATVPEFRELLERLLFVPDVVALNAS
ncbi:MAG: bifunctional alpha,alpha-trehalose-phosphate synthase (UDP-forming)/trehalose-phosphatase [Polyangiaceae bacterium]|nr:bifunctional alpha,alpha-trehalose-phosphate synthase (UDP-forming)/trehalose-phosphatase [Polyangiaceae bacterium]